MFNKIDRNQNIFKLINLFIIFILIFGRSFIGVSLFGFRIGEVIVAFSFFMSFFVFMSLKISKYQFDKIKSLIIIHIGFVSTFFIIAFLTNSSLIDSYTYKSSSYIWTIGYLYLGYLIFRNYKLSTSSLNILILVALLVYFNEVSKRLYLPEFLIDFLTSHSDKPLQNHKGYDLILVFVISTFYYLNKMPNRRLSLDIFILISALYIPLIVWKSKGATLALIFYVISQLIYNSKYFKKNLLRNTILIFLTLTVIYTSSIVTTSFETYEISNEDAVEFVIDHKFSDNSWLFLYVVDGRIYSYNGNANWRLQIWQDVVIDSLVENKYIYGFGYKEKIPAMDVRHRAGWDGTNENVHNFLINNYARGGIIHLFLTIYFFSYIIFFQNKNSLRIFIFVMPFLITSFFGASMESAHFPSIFYFFLGSFFTDSFD